MSQKELSKNELIYAFNKILLEWRKTKEFEHVIEAFLDDKAIKISLNSSPDNLKKGDYHPLMVGLLCIEQHLEVNPYPVIPIWLKRLSNIFVDYDIFPRGYWVTISDVQQILEIINTSYITPNDLKDGEFEWDETTSRIKTCKEKRCY